MAYLLQQLLTGTETRQPEQVAVVFKERSISYGELEARSNQLARALVERGIRRGERVGICLSKSIEAVVAVFGVLKAGAVYVPLDPASPARRLAFIVENCGMEGLIATRRKHEELRCTLQAGSGPRWIVLTDNDRRADETDSGELEVVGWRTLEGLPAAPLELDEAPIEDDLAYILYTSGSTGEPKGVMISHRASLTFVNWACACFQLRASDRVSSHAPLHFDLSIFDLFASVKAGASIILVPEELSVFPLNLASFVEQQRITVWYSVPSVLTRLALYGELQARDLSSLRQILFAGEVFPARYLRQLREAIPHAEYYNLYGPTETNVCTYFRVGELAPNQYEPVPIGRACANIEVFAVNEQGRLAAAGEVGELYVRGPSLMRGYWGLPERSAAALVPHPVTPPLWDERVYRTGDLVTRDTDGNYRFVGRRDSMVKSRGYRIELGEIEATLYAHPAVEEAAVLAIPDDEIGSVIYAVVVSRDASLTAARLQQFCAQRIPRYMIPSEIELRSRLPKTSTGKVDKPSLVRERLAARTAPRSKEEIRARD